MATPWRFESSPGHHLFKKGRLLAGLFLFQPQEAKRCALCVRARKAAFSSATRGRARVAKPPPSRAPSGFQKPAAYPGLSSFPTQATKQNRGARMSRCPANSADTRQPHGLFTDPAAERPIKTGPPPTSGAVPAFRGNRDTLAQHFRRLAIALQNRIAALVCICLRHRTEERPEPIQIVD